MIRETIVEEVTRILQGPMGGIGEELEKNPLDFYSVGVLFPRVARNEELTDPDPESTEIESIEEVAGDNDELEAISIQEEDEGTKRKRVQQEADEVDSSGEFELTTKFRPSAAGLSILVKKKSEFKVNCQFAIYTKETKEKRIVKNDEIKIVKLFAFKHHLRDFSIAYKDGKFQCGSLNQVEEGNLISILLEEGASLSITSRRYPKNEDLQIKTFTLINSKNVDSFREQKKAEDCLFQPVISIDVKEGIQHFEDLTDLSLLSPEDLNLKLLYRNYKKYGLGHGISANWDEIDGLVQKVYTQVLPQERVNGVDLNPPIFTTKDVLYVKRLGGSGLDDNYNWNTIRIELEDFAELYKNWIRDEEEFIDRKPKRLPEELIEKARQNLTCCNKLLHRMQKGIRLLNDNADARKAFEDANRAMFMQRVMADFSRHRRDENRVQHDNSAFDDRLPNYSDVPHHSTSGKIWKNGALDVNQDIEKKGNLARWRPFQLAFLLSQIEGVIDPTSEDRDTVDLIWFPTGGGKTEAYLGLTAFTIFHRRLHSKRALGNPDNGAGVSVFMRYTLRLLNKQQFERASIIICACDLIRRLEPENYGKIRVSNGIWMGRSMTPNSQADQITAYGNYINQINNGNSPSSFLNSPPLLSCPCCGNRLIRERKNNIVVGRWGYFRALNNMNVPAGRFLIACTNSSCDFHVTPATVLQNTGKLLPIYEVDQTIYSERPSLLFSTVDKFVQLAWKNEAFNLFNLDFSNGQINRIFPAPDLIIQDELHLISSALGTIYGVYEIVIDKMCREAGGVISKVIGATATVRNAEEQCKRLYGRSNFLQFPPPATNADDSFYARKITGIDRKNRLYVGFMASGVTTSTALIRLTSVLLERIPALVLPNEEVDKHYTLVVYFNALKELGKFRTFLTDDIVAYRKLIANHFNTFFKPFNSNALCELSSVMTADDITNGLDQLEKTKLPSDIGIDNPMIRRLFEKGIRTSSDLYSARGPVWRDFFLNATYFNEVGLKFTNDFQTDISTFIAFVEKLFIDKSQPIHVAPATNMISVGVDIPRLNTMIVNGQPKTTAEYIQASSRVGREDPGVVFTFLAPTKNRDRSHYEQFKAFHQAYYYFVESSSVTPFSEAALEKVLPTVLVALTRSLYLNGLGGAFLARDETFANFIEEIFGEIRLRVNNIYANELRAEIFETLNKIKGDFLDKMVKLGGNRRLAEYNDFLEINPITRRMETRIRNHTAIYNSQAQFVDSILKDHVPTMQTLRNVESSTIVSIKS